MSSGTLKNPLSDRQRTRLKKLAQHFLFRYPLYSQADPDASELKVLFIGFGPAAEAMLDEILPASQMMEKTPVIVVAGADENDILDYLYQRPALESFFCVNGIKPDLCKEYGYFNFQPQELQTDSEEEIFNRLSSWLEDSPAYIYIDLQSDAFNRAASQRITSWLAQRGDKAFVAAFQMDRVPKDEECEDEILENRPVYMVFNDAVGAWPEHAEIERMAFNTHQTWKSNLMLNADLRKEDFRKRYYHDSSISFVIGIKHLLWKYGVRLSLDNQAQAAAVFAKDGLKNRTSIYTLIWMDHKRWNTEKACSGMQPYENLISYFREEKNNSARHIGLVVSSPEKPDDRFLSCKANNKWLDLDVSVLKNLDDLDRLSVALYRENNKRANKIKSGNFFEGHYMLLLEEMAESDPQLLSVFMEWKSVLKSLFHGDSRQAGIEPNLRSRVEQTALQVMKQPECNRFISLLKETVNSITPLFDTVQTPDWKQNDERMIRSIPFILTFTENSKIAVPFSTGSSERIFSNIAASLIMDPDKLYFLMDVRKAGDFDGIHQAMKQICALLNQRMLKADVQIVLTGSTRAMKKMTLEWIESLQKIDEKRISSVDCFEVDDLKDISRFYENCLFQFEKKGHKIMLERNNTRLSSILQSTGVYDQFFDYCFDSVQGRFFEAGECPIVKYVVRQPQMSVSDIMKFNLSHNVRWTQPEVFDEIDELWNLYHSNSNTWKGLCRSIGQTCLENDLIFQIPIPRFSKFPVLMTFMLPISEFKSALKIVNALKTFGCIGQNSNVKGKNSTLCQVSIFGTEEQKQNLTALFSTPGYLKDPEDLNISRAFSEDQVNIEFDHLMVSGVTFPAEFQVFDEKLLNSVGQRGYLLNLRRQGRPGQESWSFTFASKQYKRMFTQEGSILEYYCYSKLKEDRYFDDVVTGCEIDWNGQGVLSEIDCIVVKGFRSLFIECKARPDLSQDFYYKLQSLSSRFGINSKPVLIADLQERTGGKYSMINEMQKGRGEEMGIYTISDAQQITNIQSTIRALFEDSEFWMEQSW